MELVHFRTIVEGLNSLAEIEREHPELGANLLNFVNRVSNCCEKAYERLSEALGEVRNLPSKPTPQRINKVLKKINDAPNSKWFKEVSGICDELAAIAKEYEPSIAKQIRYTDRFGDNFEDASKDMTVTIYAAHYKIAPLLSLLQQHERELKDDIRKAVAIIQTKLGPAKDTGNVEEARKSALEIQNEISKNIDQIKKLRHQIVAGSSKGVSAVLTTVEDGSPDLANEMQIESESPKYDSSVVAAKITSRRALIGGVIAAIITVTGTIAVAIINRGCGSSPPQPQVFTGRVFNKNNTSEKIRNARVSLEGDGIPPLVTTDSEGIFSFSLTDPNKEFRLLIEVNGYESYDLRVVPTKIQGTQPIPLTPKTDMKASLSGRIYDQNNNPIQGAKVRLDNVPEISSEEETSTDGHFTFKEIPRKYGESVRISVIKEGFQPSPHVEDVTLGKNPPEIKLRKTK